MAVPDHAVFTRMVADAVATIQRGDPDKVVLSRLMDIVTVQPVDTAALMQRVIAQNPNSYHFHLPLAEGGALVGASPELMLRKQGRDFSSCPLAGISGRALPRKRLLDRRAADRHHRPPSRKRRHRRDRRPSAAQLPPAGAAQ
ncbi:hypothetical protein E05_19390 [Plautia stali symbiont]|nr:hypothetical protein E05_19390 [Plautia stali symbiont]